MVIFRGLLGTFVLGLVVIGLVAAIVVTRPVQTCTNTVETLPTGTVRTETCMVR